ncbi:MAG: FAD-binding oxidoreductase [Candidatus Limnocylindrales bacterium]
MSLAPHLDALRRSFAGELIAPGDPAFAESRRVWNARFDRQPSLVLRPSNAADVATAIRFGRDRDLEIAVRSGGHSAAGHSATDGGLVIDMSGMRGVTVDPGRRTARANGGALLAELDTAAQAHGLVCPVGVIGHTGVAGLTLGGGVGRLQRHFGLTIDSLRGVELVTADGRRIRASATENPELFWGMRGAGPNFGIVTAFEFDLHAFGPDLNRGMRMYPAAQAQAAWSMVRDFATTAPDAVSAIMGIGRAEPAGEYPEAVAGGPIVLVAWNHSGSAADVERDTAALRKGPEPVLETSGSQPYLEVQTANDLVMGPGHRTAISGGFTNDLGPASLDAFVEHVAGGPAGSSASITVLGGAIGRVDDDDAAFTGRSARFDVSPDTEWEDPADDEVNEAWVSRAMAIIGPDLVTGRYGNELSEAGPAVTRAIYGEAKMTRLVALKCAWDPDNVLRLNHNIAPA